MPPEVWYAVNMNEVKETEMKKTWTEKAGEWGIRLADRKIARLEAKRDDRAADFGRSHPAVGVLQIRIDRLTATRTELAELLEDFRREMLDEVAPCEGSHCENRQ